MRSPKFSIAIFLVSFTVLVITSWLGYGFTPQNLAQWLWWASYAFTFAYLGVLLEMWMEYQEEKKQKKEGGD